MQRPIKLIHLAAAQKPLRFRPSAKEARPMPRRQCRYLVEKEQRRIAIAHRLMTQALV